MLRIRGIKCKKKIYFSSKRAIYKTVFSLSLDSDSSQKISRRSIWEHSETKTIFWPINGANFYMQVLAHCVKSGQWTCSRWVKNTENTHIYKHTHTYPWIYVYYDHLEPLLFLPCDLGVIWSIPPPFCQLTFRTSALSDQ